MQTQNDNGPTLDELAATLRGSATEIGRRMVNADDDWVPVMFVQDADGHMAPPQSLVPYFATRESKHAFFCSLPSYARRIRPRSISLILSAWVSYIEPNADGSPIDLLDRARASEDPNRQEIVTLTVAERGRIESWSADIMRTAVGPRLAPWEHAEAAAGGMIIDALTEAFA